MRKMMTIILSGIAFLGCLGSVVVAGGSGSDWSTWRGPNMDATVDATGSIPADAGLKLRWRTPLGSGYSSVSIGAEHAVTMFSDGTFDNVIAFDADSGAELWRQRTDSTYVGHHGSHDGPISTPAIAGNGVYLLGPRGQLLAFDLKTGEQLWSQDLVAEYGAVAPFYGFTTSPLVIDDLLIVEVSGKDGTIAAFERETGKLLWKAGTDTVSYQSPMIINSQGQQQLMCVGNSYLYGLDPRSGKLDWEYKHQGGKRGPDAASMHPVPVGHNRFFLTYKRNESALIKFNRDPAEHEIEEVWKNREIRGSYDTPVYHQGYLYGYSNRFLTCVNAETGERAWRSRRPGDGFTILVDGHLAVVTKKGGLHIIKASPEKYQEVASLDLFPEHAWSPASFAQGRFYARSFGELAAVDILGQGPQAASGAEEMDSATSSFSRFLAHVEQANDKKAVVDEFIKAQKAFPIIEGDDRVHLVYRGQAEDISLQSDILGDRREEPLSRVAGTDLFYYSTTLEPDAAISYRFIKDYETTVIDSLNSESAPSTWGEYSVLHMPKWRRPPYMMETAAGLTGTIDSVHFESKIIEGSRRLDVYLPHGYHGSEQRYPVAYVNGGTAAQNWGQMKKTLDQVMGKSVAPVVVVFIPQTEPARGGEFFGDLKEKYVDMVVTELVPFIEQTYRAEPAASHRAAVGMGFAGIPALYSAFKHPDVFGKVGARSALLWNPNLDFVMQGVSQADENELQIYLEWGKYDWRSPLENWGVLRTHQKFTSLLQEKGHSPRWAVANDGRGWASFRYRSHKIFEALFPHGR